MSRFALIIIGLVFAFLIYLGIAYIKQSYRLLPVQSAKTVDNVPFSDWHPFKSQKFSVMLPVMPQHATQHVNDPKTKQPRFYDMYVAQNDAQTIFMVSLIKFPDSQAESPDILQKTIINDMLKSNHQNQLKSMKNDSFQNHMATDFTIENDRMIINGKTFMVGPILYLISGIFSKQNYNPQEYDYFINSFKLQENTKDKK